MTKVDSIGNNTIIPKANAVNFKSVSASPQRTEFDTFVRQQEKEQKNAKRKQNLMYGLQAGAMLAIIASVVAAFKMGGGMGKKTSELKEIWSDLGKSAKVDELALPESLNKFITIIRK